MPDREKAIRILEGSYKNFVLRHNGELLTVNELIALLKAQEPVVMAGAELTDAELIEAIRKAPLILNPSVDAVPIIRCANCKWWNPGTLGVAHRCAALNIATTGEFYCAAAER